MYPLPLLVETRASTLIRVLLAVAHLAAVAALFFAHLPAAARWVGAALLAFSLAAYLRRAAPTRLRCAGNGRLEIRRETTWRGVRVLPDSVALPWLIVLRWRENGRRHSLVLPRNRIDVCGYGCAGSRAVPPPRYSRILVF